LREFVTEYRVIYADVDAMGVVYHANYIDMFERSRGDMLRALGYPYPELEKIPLWLPCTEVHCEYKNAGKYDELLEIACRPVKMTFVKIRLEYEVRRKETGELLATGHTVHACTDEKLKPVPAKKVVPELYEIMRGIAEENQASG
jgi:acyl-CoA thioester hydrolase